MKIGSRNIKEKEKFVFTISNKVKTVVWEIEVIQPVKIGTIKGIIKINRTWEIWENSGRDFPMKFATNQ